LCVCLSYLGLLSSFLNSDRIQKMCHLNTHTHVYISTHVCAELQHLQKATNTEKSSSTVQANSKLSEKPNWTSTYINTHIHICIYIYMSICIYTWLWISDAQRLKIKHGNSAKWKHSGSMEMIATKQCSKAQRPKIQGNNEIISGNSTSSQHQHEHGSKHSQDKQQMNEYKADWSRQCRNNIHIYIYMFVYIYIYVYVYIYALCINKTRQWQYNQMVRTCAHIYEYIFMYTYKCGSTNQGSSMLKFNTARHSKDRTWCKHKAV